MRSVRSASSGWRASSVRSTRGCPDGSSILLAPSTTSNGPRRRMSMSPRTLQRPFGDVNGRPAGVERPWSARRAPPRSIRAAPGSARRRRRLEMKSLALLFVVALAVTGSAVAADRPNDLAGPPGPARAVPASSVEFARPDGRDAPDAADVPVAAPTILLVDDGFDWGDAGIGLAGGLGLVLVLGGLLAGVQHQRRVSSV